MGPKLILTYFDVPGAAEPARWALQQSGMEWEDRRLSREEFAVLKPRLYPSDDFEAAKCDAVLYCAIDCYVNFRPALVEQDPAKKLKMFEDLAVNFFPRWLTNIEKKLEASKDVYFYDKMSVADILIANRVKKLIDGDFVGVPTTIADSYPNVLKLHDSIVGEPKIAEFIAKHAK